MAEATTEAKRVFELYVDQLVGESAELDEALIVRLRWFGEDLTTAAKRLSENPNSTLDVVKALSSVMQELDQRAGEVAASREHVASARRWAVLIPETAVHS